MPQFYMPDEAATAELYRAHAAEVAQYGQGGANYVKWPGPGGAPWDNNVRAPFESALVIRIAPAWALNSNFFKPQNSHFWKSYRKPKGNSLNCPGPEICLICQAREAAMASGQGDPQAQQKIKDSTRVRRQFLYNCFVLDNYQGHFMKDGTMRPFILAAGAGLHHAIGDIIEGRGGLSQVVHPQMGRPLRVKKKKTGPYPMDIEYSVLDLDPGPLDPAYFPALGNLWNLDDLAKAPDQAAMLAAVQDLGLPIPGGAPGPGPVNPPYGSPYTAQVPANYPAQGYQPQAPAPWSPAPPAAPQGQMPYRPPAQYQPQTWQGAPAPAPDFTPPPVTSATSGPGPGPVAAPYPYQPQPSQSAPQGPGPRAPYQPPPPPLRQPVTAPSGEMPQAANPRDQCFGNYNPGDQYCQTCPPGTVAGCQAMSTAAPAGGPPPAASGPTMDQLQAQLGGKPR
jgi:hypothetical protein